jgi:hypothetical protein
MRGQLEFDFVFPIERSPTSGNDNDDAAYRRSHFGYGRED